MSRQRAASLEQYARVASQNRYNQKIGQTFEEVIETACVWYSKQRIAEIQKTPEPFQVIRRMPKGQFLGFYKRQAQPDFKGVMRGGKTLIFEAKHTSTDRMSENVLSETQRQLLTRYSSLGAKCFVVVSFNCKDFYRVPYNVFGDMKKHFGRKYFKAAEAEEYRVTFNQHGILDFLQGL